MVSASGRVGSQAICPPRHSEGIPKNRHIGNTSHARYQRRSTVPGEVGWIRYEGTAPLDPAILPAVTTVPIVGVPAAAAGQAWTAADRPW